ncbi:MAG: energy transducer TonB [Rhodothalassiaceae bacterium]
MLIRTFLAGAALVGLALTTTPRATAAAEDLAAWQRQVARAVLERQQYPRSALARNIEGSARVRVTIDRSGSVQGYEIMEDTGHSVLDREVPKLIDRVSPFPAPPSDVEDGQLTFILPIIWRLQ